MGPGRDTLGGVSRIELRQVMADPFVLHAALNPSTAYMAMTASTSVGHSDDSSHPILRPLPVMSPDAEILEANDPCLGYDAEIFQINRPHGR